MNRIVGVERWALPRGMFIVVLFSLFALGCGKDPQELERRAMPCIPGQLVSCTCAGGWTGAQLCEEDRSFGACECEPPGRDVDGPGTPLPEEPDREDLTNACGGFEPLEGVLAMSCGDCDDGVFVCEDEDTLACRGARRTNVCGGCKPMPHAIGDRCGPCGQGSWQCGEDGGLVCVGDLATNACGGCASLMGERHFICEVGQQQGLWRCSGPESLRCVGPSRNACGGTAPLAALPGSACGRCDGGRWVCHTADQVICENPERGVNACGGCAVLDDQVGLPCGECGGVWECDGLNGLRCSRTFNLCGSCAPLGQVPGTSCGQGLIVACQSDGEVACVDAMTTNACGGTVPLKSPPGTACGPCRDGVEICASPNVVACLGARQEKNVCGGCTNLWAEPGENCGLDQIWACSSLGNGLVCEREASGQIGDRNACDGGGILEGEPGEVCEHCGVYVCSEENRNSVACLGGSPGTDVDRNNCGACGRRCSVGTSCVGGQCVDDPVVQLAAGREHTCALRQSGRVICWGSNAQGRLGDGTTTRPTEPVEVAGLFDAVEISAGDTFSCALRATGAVLCWGSSRNWRQGREEDWQDVLLATEAPLLEGVRSLSLGYGFGCGINEARRVVCWGENRQGQLGRGTESMSEPPGEVPGLEDVVDVRAASFRFTSTSTPDNSACALRENGEVWCWGAGNYGNLGDGGNVDSSVPVQVEGLPPAVQLGGGGRSNCALLEDAEVWCWGATNDRELGRDATLQSSRVPAPVEEIPGVGRMTRSFGGHNCAIGDGGALWCWGGRSGGAFGAGEGATQTMYPFRVPFYEGLHVVESVGGALHRCTLIADGRVYCAGTAGGSAYNALGDGQLETFAANRSFPVAVHGIVPPESEYGFCRDGVDSDGNGLVDCADRACHIDLGSRASVLQSGIFQGDLGNYFQGSCGTSTGPEKVFAWTAPASGRYVVSTEGSQLATTLYVLTSCLATATGVERGCDVSSGRDGRSRLVIEAEKSQTYFIVVDTAENDYQGTYQLRINRGN